MQHKFSTRHQSWWMPFFFFSPRRLDFWRLSIGSEKRWDGLLWAVAPMMGRGGEAGVLSSSPESSPGGFQCAPARSPSAWEKTYSSTSGIWGDNSIRLALVSTGCACVAGVWLLACPHSLLHQFAKAAQLSLVLVLQC